MLYFVYQYRNCSRLVGRFFVLLLFFWFVTPAQAAGGRSAQQVFADTCAFCHGHEIAPGVPIIFDIRGRKLPPAVIKTFVRQGIGSMPAFTQTQITEDELAQLAQWLSTVEAPPASTRAEGSKR